MRHFKSHIHLRGSALLIIIALGSGVSETHAQARKAPQPKEVLIELDGSNSADPEGKVLRYGWRQTSGPKIMLSDKNAVKPYFRTSVPGLYRFQLVVSDGKLTSQPATVEVMVERQNLRPEAIVLRKDLVVEAGQAVRFDGSASRDADGDTLAYHWRQASGPPLYLRPESLKTSKLKFIPKKAGVYELELIVSDGKARSHITRCRLVVRPPNQVPVARVKARSRVVIERPPEIVNLPDQSARPVAVFPAIGFVETGTVVTLDGVNSHSPKKKPLRYYWKQKSGPFIRSFKREADYRMKFTPREAGDYVFELVVSDGEIDSLPVIRTIQVRTGNEAPVAVVEAPTRAVIGAKILLDGSRSFDREGKKLTHHWQQTGGPKVTNYDMSDPRGSSVPAFSPTAPGTYEFSLTVSDGQKSSKPASVSITVLAQNQRPAARISGNLRAHPGETVVIQGAGKDPEGEPVSYAWTQVAGPTRLLNDTATQQSLTLNPQQTGLYTFQLVVSDGTHTSRPVTTKVLVAEKVFESFPPPEISFEALKLEPRSDAPQLAPTTTQRPNHTTTPLAPELDDRRFRTPPKVRRNEMLNRLSAYAIPKAQSAPQRKQRQQTARRNPQLPIDLTPESSPEWP